jgi:F-type H+-transporting ATPase subunit delta
MRNQKHIASRYSCALFETAVAAKVEQAVLSDLQWFATLLIDNNSYRRVLESLISARIKSSIFEDVIKKRPIQKFVANLVRILLINNRFNLFKEVSNCYESLLKKDKGVITVVVESASFIDEAMEQEIVSAFGVKRRQLDIKYHIDKSLLQGMVFKFDSKILDCSVRNKIQKIRKELLEAPLAS